MNENLIYKELTDLTRLPEIFSLTHDTFVESGLILPKKNGMLNLYPHLNKIKETAVIIAEFNGKIIATNSATIDGEKGLHTDVYFKSETDEYRKTHKNLGSSWRIATDKAHRRDIRIIMNLIKYSLLVGEKMGMETCLFIFEKRHERIYKKLIGAETIAEKVCDIEGFIEHKMHMVLMVAAVGAVKKKLTKTTAKKG
jgi:hypothetical protein